MFDRLCKAYKTATQNRLQAKTFFTWLREQNVGDEAFVEGLVKARNDLDRSAVSEVMDSIKRKANSEDLTERECSRGMHCRP